MKVLGLKAIDSFSGEWEFFSNFVPCVIHFEGYNYPSVEHAYQAAKTLSHSHRMEICRLYPNQAGKAKRLGRKVPLRSDWEEVKIDIMKRFLMQKFSYEKFRNKLMESGERELVEGNYWHDNFWGNCICSKCERKFGKNMLGNLLMEVRRILRNG